MIQISPSIPGPPVGFIYQPTHLLSEVLLAAVAGLGLDEIETAHHRRLGDLALHASGRNVYRDSKLANGATSGIPLPHEPSAGVEHLHRSVPRASDIDVALPVHR